MVLYLLGRLSQASSRVRGCLCARVRARVRRWLLVLVLLFGAVQCGWMASGGGGLCPLWHWPPPHTNRFLPGPLAFPGEGARAGGG